MTHITEPRVIGNHADMGRLTPESSPVTVQNILRAGLRRRAVRTDLAAARSAWDSEGGATEQDISEGQGD